MAFGIDFGGAIDDAQDTVDNTIDDIQESATQTNNDWFSFPDGNEVVIPTAEDPISGGLFDWVDGTVQDSEGEETTEDIGRDFVDRVTPSNPRQWFFIIIAVLLLILLILILVFS